MTEQDDDDLTAAEYVLGTLDADERATAERRRSLEPVFGGAIAAWERRLVPLSEASLDADPPAQVWRDIVRRLGFAGTAGSPDGAFGRTVVALNRSVQRWRWATVGVSALAACLAALVVTGALRSAPAGPQLVAFLQKTDESPAIVVKADLRDGNLAVHPLVATAPPGRSYELWIIDSQLGAPKSLGVIDSKVSTHALPPRIDPAIVSRATYAVTNEPAGGSPTGAPSGPPIFVGHLVAIGS